MAGFLSDASREQWETDMNITIVESALAIIVSLSLETIYLKRWKLEWEKRNIFVFSQKSGTYLRVLGSLITGFAMVFLSQYAFIAVAFSALTWLSLLTIETDLRSNKIPKEPCWVVFGIGTAAGVLSYSLYGLISAVISFLILGGIFLLLALLTKGGLGSGDLRLVLAFTPLAWWLGVLPLLYGLFFASILQLFIRLILLTVGRHKNRLPFGPALVIGLNSIAALSAGGLFLTDFPILL